MFHRKSSRFEKKMLLKVTLTPILKQFITIICCNLLSVSYNVSFGWITINSNELQSENSTIPTGPLDINQISIAINMVNVGALIGNFAIVPFILLIGPKRAIHLLCIPLISSILLIIFVQNVYFIYSSRLLSGFVAGGLPVVIPSMINDISFNNVRGALNSLYDTSMNLGLIISFFLGNCLSYMDQPKAYLIFPIVFMIVMFLLPESPEFWTKHGKEKEANSAIKFYKGIIKQPEYGEQQTSASDYGTIKENHPENDEIVNESTSTSKLTLSDFFTPEAKKACFISFTSITLSYFCGIYVILAYVTEIFTRTGSSLSPKMSSLLVSITSLVGNFVFLAIVERFDRRTFYIGSSIFTALGFFSFCAYCALWLKQPEYEWMPTVFFACIVFGSCVGLMAIPYTISIEVFPKRIRPVCLAIAISLEWIILFIVAAIFPISLQNIGLFWSMMIFGVVCLLNAIFGVFFIPETRGKSHEEIMELLTQ